VNRRRLWAITRKEFIQILRDRPTLVIVLVMPVMMMLIFGYAVSTDVDRIPTVVFNQDPGGDSRFLLEKFQQSQYFNFTGQARSYGEIREMIESGVARAALVIPPDYSSNLAAGEVARVQLIIDGSDPLVATTASSTGQAIVQSFSARLVEERIQKMGLGNRLHLPVEVRPRVWYNPDLESLRFNLPGLVGVILQNITVLLTAFALVRERERGTIEQLIVTPIKPGELILGKLIPYVLIAFLEVGFTLAVAVWWFGVEISGSLWLLLALSLFFLLVALGIGLFISTLATNQLQAMQMTMAFLLPTILLSGFIFPREAMPPAVYVLGYTIPLTYFLKVLRGIILKGVGLTHLWREVLILAIYGVAILSLAALRFRKKLD